MKLIRQLARRYIRQAAIGLDKISGGRINPEQITLISLAGHIPVVWLIVSGELLWAGLTLIFFGLFDVLDGELARYQKTASPRGMVLDASSDRLKLVALFTSATYFILMSGDYRWAWLATLALGIVVSIAYLKAKAEVAVALKKPGIAHHKLNLLYHEGLVEFDIINVIFIAGLLSGYLLPAVALIALLGISSLFERYINIIRSLDAG